MILINSRFLTQPITGVQRYAIEMSRILKKIDPSIRFIAPKNIVHREIAEELGVEVVGNLTGHLWEQIELPIHLRKYGSPLLLALATTAPLFYSKKIVTIHDLAFFHFPKAISWKFRLLYKFLIPRVLNSSLHITTVSEFSKNDIHGVYNTPKEQLSVIYNASSFASDVKAGVNNRQKIIIAVGSVQPNKNIEALVLAFDIFKKNTKSNYILKLVGGLDKKVFQGTSLINIIGDRKDIELTGYLSDRELFSLYNSSSCFIFPSLFEGFGIPPLEAMACGCPVIASTAASIPEICGDAALYCDPHSADDIAQKIAQLLSDETLQTNLIAKGYENIKRFSWEQSASSLFNLAKKYQ
jgi:glycosyltransferase involved in cell wall biosynthesis